MKIRLFLIYLFALYINLLPGNKNTDMQCQSLLEKKEYFKLRTLLSKYSSGLSEEKKLYYSSFIDNAFNRNEESNTNIGILLDKYSAQLTDSSKMELLFIQQDNYVKTFQYKNAYTKCKNIYENYKPVIDSIRLKDLENSIVMWKALADVPPQQTIIEKSTVINWKRDKAKLMTVPVKINEKQFDFIFDTGANLSTINRSLAEQLGLKILDASFNVESSTGIVNKSSLCIIENMKLGDIILKNVVFLVLPDEQLYFPQINYRVNGIIGYPVIEKLKEVRIHKSGTITIPLECTDNGLSNLAMEGLMPIVNFATDEDTLIFHFDTGATSTDLFKPYFDRYKNFIVENGELKTKQRGGAGGIIETQLYILDHFTFYIGNKKVTLPEVDVLIKDIEEDGDKFYGNIGQDLINSFDEMIISFKYMFIDFN